LLEPLHQTSKKAPLAIKQTKATHTLCKPGLRA
jgi:hypothetical protein